MGVVRSKTFPDCLESVGSARRWIAEVLTEIGWEGTQHEAVLLVSELVTNAVRHSNSCVRVMIYQHDGGLWTSVTDSGPGKVTQRRAEPTDTEGRGLSIVDHLSGTWGVITEPQSKSVWFELTQGTAVE